MNNSIGLSRCGERKVNMNIKEVSCARIKITQSRAPGFNNNTAQKKKKCLWPHLERFRFIDF